MNGRIDYSIMHDFRGLSIALINVDDIGLNRLADALRSICMNEIPCAMETHSGKRIEFIITDDTYLRIDEQRMTLSLNVFLIKILLEKVLSMENIASGHHYLDGIKSEYDEIILSKNEYPFLK